MTNELYYFTGTGNGLHIAKSIKKSLSEVNQDAVLIPINTLDLTKKIHSSAERVGIIYPTYAMTAPEIVKSFAKRLRVSNGSYMFLYGHSGGAGASGSTYSIQRILSENRIKVSNTFETKFPSNSTVFKYTPEKLQSVLNESEVSIKSNMKPIVDKASQVLAQPNVIKNISNSISKTIAGASENMLQFKVIDSNEDCIGCSVCAKVCPVENIEMKAGKPEFKDHCQMCFACINQCPKKALAFGKMKKEKLLSYRHPEVELKELMYR